MRIHSRTLLAVYPKYRKATWDFESPELDDLYQLIIRDDLEFLNHERSKLIEIQNSKTKMKVNARFSKEIKNHEDKEKYYQEFVNLKLKLQIIFNGDMEIINKNLI